MSARSRATVVSAALLAIVLLSSGVWRYGYVQALGPLAARGAADLALAADRLVTQLARFREAAVLTVDHPVLSALHGGGDPAAAEALLLEMIDKTSALTAYYADREGTILAAATPQRADLSQRLVRSGVFQRALQGALGVAQGTDIGLDRRAYVFAAPAFAPEGGVRGVLVVAVDIDRLEIEWRGAWPTVYFTDAAGQVFIANRSEMLGWQQVTGGMRTPEGRWLSVAERQAAGLTIWKQAFSPYVPGRAVHLTRPLPVIDLTGEALLDVAPARRLAALQAAAVGALCLFFASLLFVATERRRALSQANVLLEGRVRDRTRDLMEANAALRHEVTERQEAEAALRRTQAELVQAGKLSALGQMSAGISHELNQPLMAIRQFADNGAQFLSRGAPDKAAENLGKISQSAARAARIIKNLRAFARNESEPMTRVDLGHVIAQSIELTETRLASDAVALAWQAPERSVMVRGGEVRLTQVFVNLINNAADAMAGQAEKRIEIRLEAPAGQAPRVTVEDRGPGIADPDRIFEPFYTTKQVGQGDGMGLGLSISYGLVQSFGGQIRGENTASGGARFTVTLEPWGAAPHSPGAARSNGEQS